MQTEIVISGFGGQGVLFVGMLLAYTAMDENMEVTWYPSYGPEMRGGTANCTVIIADEEIGAPVVRNPTAVIAMNLPSMTKYESSVKSAGVMIINQSMVNREPMRKDIRALMVPGTEIAESIGSSRIANIVMLGALLKLLPVLTVDAVERSLVANTPDRHKALVPYNIQALKAGLEFAEKELSMLQS